MFISFSKFLGKTGIRVGVGFKTGNKKKKSASASFFAALASLFVIMFQIMFYMIVFSGWCCYAMVYGIIWIIKAIISAISKNKQPPAQSDSFLPPNPVDSSHSDGLTDFLKPLPEPEPPKNKKPIFSDSDKKIIIIVVAVLAASFLFCGLPEILTESDATTTQRAYIETTNTTASRTKATTTTRTTKQTTSKTTKATTSASTTETTATTPVITETTETTPTITETTETTTRETTTSTAKTETTERQYDYVLNTNSGIFHYPSCRHANRISAANRSEYHGTRSSVISKGFSPCGVCHP